MRKIAWSGMFLLAAIGSAHAAEPIGEWQVEEKVATIKIVDCDSRLWGVVASEVKPGIDSNNPDKAKRTRPTLGMPILLGMTKSTEEKNRWDGKIYNAKDGETYKASITLKSPNTLRVEGCYVWPLCGGQTWTRVAEAPPPAVATAPKAPPKTVGSKGPLKKSGPGAAAAPQEAAVSEVCLLPEVTGAAH